MPQKTIAAAIYCRTIFKEAEKNIWRYTIYATDIEDLQVNTQDFQTVQEAYKESSWKKTFENTGYEVECMFRGLGELEAIQKLFAEHTQVAVEKLKGNENE